MSSGQLVLVGSPYVWVDCICDFSFSMPLNHIKGGVETFLNTKKGKGLSCSSDVGSYVSDFDVGKEHFSSISKESCRDFCI